MRWVRNIWVSLLACCTVFAAAAEQIPRTHGSGLVDLMTEAELREAIKREGIPGDQFETSARENAEDRYFKCMQAFGYKRFCQCLERDLPWVINFDTYVQMVTATPRDLASPDLDSGYRQLIDQVVAVRSACVDSALPD